METAKLKKFAQYARRSLIEQVGNKLKLVLAHDSPERRESPQTIAELEKRIAASNKEQVIEKAAYIWFNRFCALRFMDVNRYNRSGVISPVEGQFQPEILAEAKAGHIDEALITGKKREQIFSLLHGSAPSRDPQTEAYRALIVAVCNDYHRAMPYLFERIADHTELLMPDDLLSGNSILAYTREAMTPDACEDVEVIGWLYQFYIAEKKDAVFAGLKKNVKITPENIPAATQLFTPHWIVRYLVENSLGRLWMLNNPGSNLTAQMEYYIAPVEPEADFLRVSSPEDIKINDPACGSGHMLTYAFDLLYAIYEEQGYDSAEIPSLILTNNLFGIEIDARAGALAAFALTMKARGKQRRFFRKGATPNICVLQDVHFEAQELADYTAEVGRDLFTDDLRETLAQFAEAKNVGSLIVPALKDVAEVSRVVDAQDFEGKLFLREVHQRVQSVLRMAEYLSPKYHVVVANPPYMGGKGMNGRLKSWAGKRYPDSKSDLFAMFMERVLEMSLPSGMMAMVNMQSWMFLSSFEKLRSKLLGNATLLSMAHLGERGFDTIGGAVVSTTAFVFADAHHPDHKGDYLRLVDGSNEAEKAEMAREAIQTPDCGWFHRASATDFSKIPGRPIAYWVSESLLDVFRKGIPMQDYAIPRQGFATGNNDRFLRIWPEVALLNSKHNATDVKDAAASGVRWFPCNKGGTFRKWYGNNEYIVNWQFDGREIRNFKDRNGKLRSRPQNTDYFFKPGVTWSTISSTLSMRYSPAGYVFETKGSVCFPKEGVSPYFPLGLMNTKVVDKMLLALSPTLDFHEGPIGRVPVVEKEVNKVIDIVGRVVSIAKSDWDAYETSWDFTTLPLLQPAHHRPSLAATYATLRQHWQGMVDEMQTLEQENNRIFIDAYGLQDELTPDVPLKEITLTCNPAYRYGVKIDEAEREKRLRADTLREFLSYAVGCMFGRYSLDTPGLILANQGETLADYLTRVPDPTFTPDDDNVIPILDGDWFPDDITERFRKFLSVTFGADTLQDNLATIEEALGKDIRRYFTRDFYPDHVKRYKKRPIYWLFASPRGTFQALIYMHRYREDTVSVVLNNYLREFRTKLTARKQSCEQVGISASASQKEKTQAIKILEKINQVLDEINEYEHGILYPLATQKIEIDLDDGVKHNYPLLGQALKKVVGLS